MIHGEPDAGLDVGHADALPDTHVEVPPGKVTHEGDLRQGESWSRAWGGNGSCDSQAVAIGPDGSLYVTGAFSGAVDFDPTDGEDIRTAQVGTGIFLTRFATDGTRVWTLTWTTTDGYTYSGWGNRGSAIAVDSDGSIFLGGQYSGTIDLDPGEGVATQQMLSGFDAFLLKLMPDRSFAWGMALHGSGRGRVTSIALRSGLVVTSGQADAAADFDPGPGELHLAGAGQIDCYLQVLDPDGSLQWARMWGGSYDEWSCKAGLSANSIVSTGSYSGAGDLDPGPGVDWHYAAVQDGFLLTFDQGGTRTGISTWGNQKNMTSNDVGAWADSIYVGGAFDLPTDFGTAELPAIRAPKATVNAHEAYLLKFDNSGARPWVRTWGGADGSLAEVLGIRAAGFGVLAVGQYVGEVDFTAGDRGAIYASQSTDKIPNGYIRAFDHDGAALWTRVLPGDSNAVTAVDTQRGIGAFTGLFVGTIDLDFAAGSDVWSSPGLQGCFAARFALAPAPSSSPGAHQ
jgi:hypothetical protein